MKFTDGCTLVKTGMLINLWLPEGLNCTPLITGPHGQGKTALLRRIAHQLRGFGIVLEGTTLKEGDITGMPIQFRDERTGEPQVINAPHYSIAIIKHFNEKYYNKLRRNGFLNGQIKMEENGDIVVRFQDGTEKYRIPARDELTALAYGVQNAHYWGAELDPEDKLALITCNEKVWAEKYDADGNIVLDAEGKPVMVEEHDGIMDIAVIVDEVNKTDQYTAIELMNVLLNKTVSGYKLPWFVQFCAASNPVGPDTQYSGVQFDPAMLDRYLKIPFSTDYEDWADYMINSSRSPMYLAAVNAAMQQSPEAFCSSDKDLQDNQKATPSPRSHELCALIVEHGERLFESDFYNNDEKKQSRSVVNALIKYKLGETGDALVKFMSTPEFMIDIREILDGKAKTIKPEQLDRIKPFKKDGTPNGNIDLVLTTLARAAVRHIANELSEDIGRVTVARIKGAKFSTKYENLIGQMVEFLSVLPEAVQVAFARYGTLTKTNGWTDPDTGKFYQPSDLFRTYFPYLTDECKQQLSAIMGTKFN